MRHYSLEMKKTISIFIFLLMLGQNSCIKEKDYYSSDGVIYGRDFTLCGCCNGWMINIDEVKYLIDSLPSNSGLNQNDNLLPLLPLMVRLDWKVIKSGCTFKHILVLRINKK
jgi:hypothetical protein